MKKLFSRVKTYPPARIRVLGTAALLVPLLLMLAACAESAAPPINDLPNLTTPRGLAAAEINKLWWYTLGLGTVVYVGVMVFMMVALFRRRRAQEQTLAPSASSLRTGNRIVMWGGVITPSIVLLSVTGFTLYTLRAVSAPEAEGGPVVEVIGRQWWWEVRYLDESGETDFVTANEVRMPVGQPVQFRLTSGDVIHSFWVPELHGKIDMIPGHTNEFWLQADEVGDYWGVCTEFCGVQHAKMNFVLVAETPEEYEAWAENQRQPAVEPAEELAQQGQRIFLESACAYCHAVEGTSAEGQFGPDLTHMASRRTLAAGAVEYNRGNLAGWLAAPQHIKPGNLMPPSDLSGTELQALVAYLDTLE